MNIAKQVIEIISDMAEIKKQLISESDLLYDLALYGIHEDEDVDIFILEFFIILEEKLNLPPNGIEEEEYLEDSAIKSTSIQTYFGSVGDVVRFAERKFIESKGLRFDLNKKIKTEC